MSCGDDRDRKSGKTHRWATDELLHSDCQGRVQYWLRSGGGVQRLDGTVQAICVGEGKKAISMTHAQAT